jgi:hypothetical protein
MAGPTVTRPRRCWMRGLCWMCSAAVSDMLQKGKVHRQHLVHSLGFKGLLLNGVPCGAAAWTAPTSTSLRSALTSYHPPGPWSDVPFTCVRHVGPASPACLSCGLLHLLGQTLYCLVDQPTHQPAKQPARRWKLR